MDLFGDSDVERAREQGGLTPLDGGRCILLPEVFGFCGGVLRALHLLNTMLTENPGRQTLLLGPIIHNDTVNQYFRDRGVEVLPESRIDAVIEQDRGGTAIVIPAFGIPIWLEEALSQRLPDDTVLDTTCHYVRAVWEFIATVTTPGATVIIHGKPDHPETRATVSRSRRVAARTVIVPGPELTSRLCRCVKNGCWDMYPAKLVYDGDGVEGAEQSLILVNQTTMLHDETMDIGAAIRTCVAAEGVELHVADSVCKATQRRQEAARNLCAQKPDCVLVVGGFQSSNTAQLYRLAAAVCQTYFIGGAGALSPTSSTHCIPERGMVRSTDWLGADVRRVGILAGASCPACDVGRVMRALARCNGENPMGAVYNKEKKEWRERRDSNSRPPA